MLVVQPTPMRPTLIRRNLSLLRLGVAIVALQGGAMAQRHNSGSSPPTAPIFHGPQTILPASTGIGALQFVPVSFGVPAPQSITRQLDADDERTRQAALSSIGAPNQYLQRGHVPFPHSVQLDFVALGASDDLDAILTVELDEHVLSAILIPDNGSWRRVATVLYPTSYSNPDDTPSAFLAVTRSLITHERYTAVFHATSHGPSGDFIENEAHLRVLNGHAVITMSFASDSRSCPEPTPAHPRSGCDLAHRWVEADPVDPAHRLLLVSATGRLPGREMTDSLANNRDFLLSHLHTYSCQPFTFSDLTMHFEPTANSAPCAGHTEPAPRTPPPPTAPVPLH